MTDVTRLLEAADRGDQQAAAELLPLVYTELCRIATAKLAHEKPGQTLDATALVHEAYIRLVGGGSESDGVQGARFAGRGHFLAAAAESMRRILVEVARKKSAAKRGGGGQRFELAEGDRVS